MKKTLTPILAWLLAAAGVPSATAGKQVATLVRIEGVIPILRYETGEEVAARLSGDRILNASIHSRDEVRTSDSSNATLKLRDGSLCEVGRNTAFSIRVSDPRTGRKPIKYKINVIAGNINFDLAADPRVKTTVKTPAGLLAPTGTEFEIWVQKSTGETRVAVYEGVVDYFNRDFRLHILLRAVQHVVLNHLDDKLTIAVREEIVDPSDPTDVGEVPPLVIMLKESQVTLPAGVTLSLHLEDGDLIATVDQGQLLVRRPWGGETVVQKGDRVSLGPVRPFPQRKDPEPRASPDTP